MADIHIVGLGVLNGDHLTLEVDAVLRRVNEVLYLDTGIATPALLEARCDRVTSLYHETYRAGASRSAGYQRAAARVIEAALDRSPVAFAIQGHPTVLVHAPSLVTRMAGALGLEVKVYPGISSLACLFAEQMIDPGVQGLQMMEATDMLLRRRPVQVDMPLLLWQVGNVETALHATRRSRPARFQRLHRYLLQHYPASHPVLAYFATPHPLLPSSAVRFALAQLPDHVDELHHGTTLFLPAVRQRPVQDPELAALLTDPAHLHQVTGQG